MLASHTMPKVHILSKNPFKYKSNIFDTIMSQNLDFEDEKSADIHILKQTNRNN